MKYTIEEIPILESDNLKDLFSDLQHYLEVTEDTELESFSVIRLDGKDLDLSERLQVLVLMKAALTEAFHPHLKADGKLD